MNARWGTRTSVRSSQLMKVNPSESYSYMLPALEAEAGPPSGWQGTSVLLAVFSTQPTLGRASCSPAMGSHAHHTVSARHCRVVSPFAASHGHPSPLGESHGEATDYLLPSPLRLYWRSKKAAGKKGESGKKGADGAYPGQLKTDF